MKTKLRVDKAVTEAGGFLQPGHVDVLYSTGRGDDGRTRLLLSNIHMFQVMSEDLPGPATVWLEVPPDQAAALDQARQTGSLEVIPHRKPWWRIW